MNKQEAVSKFKETQAIPYHISIAGEPGFCCEEKAMMLSSSLNDLGVDAVPVIGLFRWSDIKLPMALKAVPHDDESSHMFVQVRSEAGKEIYVDPTWNPELEDTGLGIAEWDGLTSTTLAVPVYKIFTPEESVRYQQEIDYSDDLATNANFYRAFNDYCDSFLEKGTR